MFALSSAAEPARTRTLDERHLRRESLVPWVIAVTQDAQQASVASYATSKGALYQGEKFI